MVCALRVTQAAKSARLQVIRAARAALQDTTSTTLLVSVVLRAVRLAAAAPSAPAAFQDTNRSLQTAARSPVLQTSIDQTEPLARTAGLAARPAPVTTTARLAK